MKVGSIGYYLPGRIVTNDELLEMIVKNAKAEVDVESLRKKLTLNKADARYFKDPDESALDMSEVAARRCLDKIGFKAEDLDLIIYTSMERTYAEPAMAIMLQDRLGAKKANAYDLSNACLSFMNAMELAKLYIDAGKYQNILIVSAEIGSTRIPWENFSIDKGSAGFSALTISDAAAAMLVQPGGWEKNFAVFDFKTFGEHHNLCMIKIGKEPTDLKLVVKSKKLAMVALEIMSEFIPRFLHYAKDYMGKMDVWFIHQVTGDFRNFCGKLEDDLFNLTFPSFSRVGNTGTVSIPLGMAMAEEEGKLKRGDHVALIVGASGFSYGGTFLVY